MNDKVKLMFVDLAKTLWLCAKQAFRPALIATFIATSGFIGGVVIFSLIPSPAREVIGYTMAQNSPPASDTPPFLISLVSAYWAVFKITYIIAFVMEFAVKTGESLAELWLLIEARRNKAVQE